VVGSNYPSDYGYVLGLKYKKNMATPCQVPFTMPVFVVDPELPTVAMGVELKRF
jgi:hypothetical protein